MKKNEDQGLHDQQHAAIMKKFGKRVKLIRKKRDISQSQLAEKCEIHYTYLSSLERGHRNVSLVIIHKLCRALNCSPNDLIEMI